MIKISPLSLEWSWFSKYYQNHSSSILSISNPCIMYHYCCFECKWAQGCKNVHFMLSNAFYVKTRQIQSFFNNIKLIEVFMLKWKNSLIITIWIRMISSHNLICFNIINSLEKEIQEIEIHFRRNRVYLNITFYNKFYLHIFV